MQQFQSAQIIAMQEGSGGFEVRWNYRGNLDAHILCIQCERLDGYVDGFTDGVLIALGVPSNDVDRICCSQGIAKNLKKETATRLAKILGELYVLLKRVSRPATSDALSAMPNGWSGKTPS